jgi:hypothetical protein
MKIIEYQKPIVRVVKITSLPLLSGTTQTISFDPNQGTSEVLGNGSDSEEWDDDDEHEYE